MSDLELAIRGVLAEGGLRVASLDSTSDTFAFEGSRILGFFLVFETPEELLAAWEARSRQVIASHQLALRRAQAKAWNTYLVLVARTSATPSQAISMSAIEEDLTGTRKLARAAIDEPDGLRRACLPLLPLQNTPRLEAVDMKEEIRVRTSELPKHVVDAFLGDADDAQLLRALETSE